MSTLRARRPLAPRPSGTDGQTARRTVRTAASRAHLYILRSEFSQDRNTAGEKFPGFVRARFLSFGFFFDFSARGGVIAAKACNNREKFTVADVTKRERNNGLVKGKRGYTFTEAIYGLSRQRGE